MFESAEIGHRISKAGYQREAPLLREALLKAQHRLLANPAFPVIVLVSGVDGAGKGETVNLFNEWMDPRYIGTHAFANATDAERARPGMWRYWQALPPRGRIAILFGSWYTDPVVQRVLGKEKRVELERRLQRIRHFERMLVAEGAVIVKLWFHLSKAAQKKRFRTLLADKLTAWRVNERDLEHMKHYDDFMRVSESVLRETDTGESPWHVIEGADAHYRSLTAGRLLLDAINRRLDGAPATVAPPAPPPAPPLDGRTIHASLDNTPSISRAHYERALARGQARLAALTRQKRMRRRSLVLVFEGMDAAGKGSAIRRVSRAMDARFYRIVPVSAPTDEERAQPYLWRFWRHVPALGQALIFDRSWYGRVLVERVEGFCAEADWNRAYHEINDFEAQLTEGGAIVVKYWLAVTLDEQLRRFREREKVAYKRFKITEDDWRNRKKWPRYEQAVSDMIERTSSENAPWNLVPANDKLYARVAVINRLCDVLEERLGG
jgi:polyphosphate:AMP phosphotransferase